METIYKNLKEVLLNDLNELLPDYEDETVSLPKLTEKTVVFGSIDPVKNTSAVVCSIYPEEQSINTELLDGEEITENRFTITFLCKNANYNVLMARMCRYTIALKDALQENYTLNGTAQNCTTGDIKYYPDCGVSEKQSTAAEIELTIYTDTNYSEE